jgi:ribose/xylose/arabinose/galactoside ABC-type transport system permease subunit
MKMLKLFILVVIVWVLVIWAILASSYRLDERESWKSFHNATPLVAVIAGGVASTVLVSLCDLEVVAPVHMSPGPGPVAM